MKAAVEMNDLHYISFIVNYVAEMGQKPSNIDNIEVTLAHKTIFFFLTL